MSLLDGHPQLLVYPDEPSFGRLFKRQQHYLSTRHLAADLMFGTPNPLHFAYEVETNNPKDKVFPAASEEMYKKIANIIGSDWLINKKLRGLSETRFNHYEFFNKYHSALVSMLLKCDDLTPKKAVSFSFAALNSAFPAETDNRYQTFKGPLSGVSYKKLDWFRANYEGPIIFIHRNPYARLYSQTLQFLAKKTPYLAPRMRDSFVGFIRLCFRNAREQQEARKIAKLSSVISVRYEDLVSDCEGTMKELCKQLNISFDKKVLIPTKLGVPVINPTDRTGGADGEISRTSVFKYKKNLTAGEKSTLFIMLLLVQVASYLRVI